MPRWIGLLGLAGLAGCGAPPPPLPLNDGAFHIQRAGTYQCTGQPVSIDGSHTNVTLDGACTRVIVRGSHNDVLVYVLPGALLEASGDSNDVTWRLIRRGAPPTLRNLGGRNDFHRNSRVPWEQDHDWYQERH